ncbi:MAG: UpxY family transcription antiterminator [Candidatus Korobacteraceae bacterium]
MQYPAALPDGFPNWYAAFTSPRHEKKVAFHFEQRQIEAFLPLYETIHRWKNRCNANLQLPLFPNYIFVKIDPRERVQVLNVPGVLYLVSAGREPLPVPGNYIAALRDGLRMYKIEPHPNVDVGDRVRIITGPMSGMEGILVRKKNDVRVVLKMEMIARSMAVEVNVADMEYAGSQPKRLSASPGTL